VLDATWTDATHRAAAVRLANRAAADLVTLDCIAPEEFSLRRLAARLPAGRDRSDATAEAYGYLAARSDPWPQAVRLDTTVPLPDTLRAAIEAADADPGPALSALPTAVG